MKRPQIDYRNVFDRLLTSFAILDPDFRYLSVSDCYCETLMKSREDLIGNLLFDLFPETPERERLIGDLFRRALGGELCSLTEIGYTIPDPDNGPDATTEIYWNVHCGPVRDTDGATSAFVLWVENVTDTVRARQLSDAIAMELQHRVANLFSMVTTIARRAAPDHEHMDTFLPSFLGRLQALAQASAQLTGANWNGLTLDSLLNRQLQTFAGEGTIQIASHGPPVALGASDALMLSMAVHELATNAGKYGGLRGGGGTVSVSWSAEADGAYTIDWHETGLTGTTVPTREGFGSTLLTHILPTQLGGEVQRHFTDGAFHFQLSVSSRQVA